MLNRHSFSRGQLRRAPGEGRRSIGVVRAKRQVLVAVAAALFGVSCAAPMEEEEEVSTESSVVSASGGACPVAARLSQGFKGKKHDGVDLASNIGTPIFAVMGGVVTTSGSAQGYGQWIQIKHDDGSMTEYGHMSKRFVQVGAKVKAGQRIANVGSEGRSTGPHLHLRTYRSASRTGAGNGMDPAQYLRERGVSLPCKPSGVINNKPPASAAENGNDGDDDNVPLPPERPSVFDDCGGRSDGWYCSGEDRSASYYCESGQKVDTWFCADNTVCRPNASGQATLYGQNPGCYGQR